jgi:murein DD-endopeptidase MepM/ murein hydrolase activator NlpD
MKKRSALICLCFAVALCAVGLSTAASADDGPTATPMPPAGPVSGSPSQLRSMYDVIRETAVGVAPSDNRTPEGQTAGTVKAEAPAATPAPRAAPQARSYPRTFSTYDALVEYASDVATRQEASNRLLAEVTMREEATSAALAEVFDPRVRGGLLHSRTDVLDDASLQSLRAELASDSATRRQLLANGAGIATASSWRLPLAGENTQDFGPTPYWFEPAFTYEGVYYPHFHTGTDIAAPWGAPIVAPAWGVITFAGTMGDGAEVVVIAHDDGLVSMYAHLENHIFPVPVKAGDTVKAGDRIGNVGLTGITTGAHLHWSAWRNGEVIDPLSMIRSQ